jgi:hypothetical protein
MADKVKGGELLGDLEFFPLDEGDEDPTSAYVLVVTDGLIHFRVANMDRERLLGLLRVQVLLLEKELVAEWEHCDVKPVG